MPETLTFRTNVIKTRANRPTAGTLTAFRLSSLEREPEPVLDEPIELPAGPDPSEIARQMLADADETAVRIIAEAKTEAQRIYDAARDEGLGSGHADARAEWEERYSALEREADRLRRDFDALVDAAEPELASLSIEIARKVLKQELAQNPEAVLSVVRATIHRVRDRSARINVNPVDLERVRGAREALLAIADGVSEIDIVSDRRVGQGGCVVETPSGNLDARIETQISHIEDILMDGAQ